MAVCSVLLLQITHLTQQHVPISPCTSSNSARQFRSAAYLAVVLVMVHALRMRSAPHVSSWDMSILVLGYRPRVRVCESTVLEARRSVFGVRRSVLDTWCLMSRGICGDGVPVRGASERLRLPIEAFPDREYHLVEPTRRSPSASPTLSAAAQARRTK